MDDNEAWQRIVAATGVNELMTALKHIGVKAGVLEDDTVPRPTDMLDVEEPAPSNGRKSSTKTATG